MPKKQQGAEQEGIEGQDVIGNGSETAASVHDNEVHRIDQGGGSGKKKADGIEGDSG